MNEDDEEGNYCEPLKNGFTGDNGLPIPPILDREFSQLPISVKRKLTPIRISIQRLS
jgi:hypothetical protein